MEQIYTIEQVREHSIPDDAWVIYKGNVYDITNFISLHPGGAILNNYLGQDVEQVWIDGGFTRHLVNNNAYSILSNYKIGKLAETFTFYDDDDDDDDSDDSDDSDVVEDLDESSNSDNNFLIIGIIISLLISILIFALSSLSN